MFLNEGINTTGYVSIVVTDKDGGIKHDIYIPNLVVSTGKYHIASRLAGILTGEGAAISHIGFGTAVTTPVISDVNLGAILGVRVPISGAITHSAGTNTITVDATFTGYAGNITEAGMFNALTGGTMICRTTFGSVPVLATDGLAISWTLTIN